MLPNSTTRKNCSSERRSIAGTLKFVEDHNAKDHKYNTRPPLQPTDGGGEFLQIGRLLERVDLHQERQVARLVSEPPDLQESVSKVTRCGRPEAGAARRSNPRDTGIATSPRGPAMTAAGEEGKRPAIWPEPRGLP